MKKGIMILSIVLLLFSYPGCYILKGPPTTSDFLEFSYNEVLRSTNEIEFPVAQEPIKLPDSIAFGKGKLPFDEALNRSNSFAILILKDGKLAYEKYFEGYQRSSMLTSFSVAKSLVSSLLGIAIEEGAIGGTEDLVLKYLPELDAEMFEDLTIQHLLDMNSHIKVAENYVTGFRLGRFYYGDDIKSQIPKLKRKVSDEYDDYKSINTQLLGLIIERATNTSLSSYLSKKIWSRIGSSNNATWSTDSDENKTEKSFCCVNGTAMDFLKYGNLYLNHGKLGEDQIIPKSWVEGTYFPLWNHWKELRFGNSNTWFHKYWYNFMKFRPIKPEDRIEENDVILNGNYEKIKPGSAEATYIGKYSELSLFARGHLGQYIFINEAQNTVMVRFGMNEKNIWFPGVFLDILKVNK